jgi:hypothetical protein
MGAHEMERIADLMASILVEGRDPAQIKPQAIEMRSAFQTVGYCFTPGLPRA